MATCQTTRWGDNYSPIVKLTVTQSSSTASTVTLSYTLQYIADYKAYTNGVGRAYSIVIDGVTVKSGTYNINEVTGTKTIASGTTTVNKGTSAKNVSFSCSFYFDVTWNKVYAGTKTASGSISIGAKTSYTVSYNANGGSGAPSAQTKWHGTNLTLSSTKPTRTGYTFQGWSTANDSTVEYAAGATYSSNASVTLYAVWKINTYYLDLNGYCDGSSITGISGYGTCDIYINGSLVSNDTTDYYTAHNYGSTYEIKDIRATTGHTYNGVYSGNLSGTITSNIGVSLNFTTNTYTIYYNANGGSGAPSATSYTYNASATTNLSSTKPTRTGYTFLGWSLSSTATTASYSAGQSWNRNNTSNYTLYAVWKIDTYTIYYNANGGSGAPSNQTKTYGTTLVLSSTVPTRSGYTFLGWATSSTATTATYSAGGNYTNNSAATLYAVWAQSSFIQTIMARYQQANGSYTSYSQVYAATLNQGDTCSWSSPETVEYKSASVSYTVGTSAETKYVTVYRKQYTISYNANGGLHAPKTQTFYYGCDLHLTNKRPTRSGYDFLGWAYASNAEEINYKQGDIYDSTDTSNPTLYALWLKRSTNIYLYDTGICEASEYVEDDSFGFDVDGTIYADSFVEEVLENGKFAIGTEFIALEISEIYIERYYLVDEQGNRLTDENGNYLFLEEEV